MPKSRSVRQYSQNPVLTFQLGEITLYRQYAGIEATLSRSQGDEDLVLPASVAKNKSSSIATTSSGSGSHRPHKMSPGPIWLLRRHRSRWTYDSSLCSLESGSTDLQP